MCKAFAIATVVALFAALVQTAKAEHIPRELTFGGSELAC